MKFEVKDVEDLNKALGEAFQEHDAKLAAVTGGLEAIKKVADDTAKRLDDVARHTVESGGKVYKFNFGEVEKAKLAWDTVFKAPTTVRMKSHRFSEFEFDPADTDDLLAQHQQAFDKLYMVAAGMKMLGPEGLPDWSRVRGLKTYQREYLPVRERLFSALEKDGFHVGAAGATGTVGSGTEWNPDEFSNRLWLMAELPHQLNGIIPQFAMPRGDFMFPVELGHLTAYLHAEQTAVTGQTIIPDGKGSTVVTGQKLFSARKLATMAWVSKEAEEDSIVAILSFLQGKVVKAIVRGRDNAILNGDTASTHMDNDVTSATDVRKAWDGLRDYAINTATSEQDAAGDYVNTDATWRDHIRGARKKLGAAFKGNNRQLALVVSGNTAIDIGSVEAFRTAYAMGAVSTNQNPDSTGFSPDGLGAFVVSEFAREDVAATGVNTLAGPNTYTTAITFYPEAWLMGTVRQVRLEVLKERYAEFDQDAVKVTWRGDMKPMLTGDHTVATIGIPGA